MNNLTHKLALPLVIALSAPALQAQTDTIPPVIICPADIVMGTDAGQCSRIIQFAPPMATDDQSTPSVYQISGYPSGEAFPMGQTLVAFEAVDGSGNPAQCYFLVDVIDNEKPLTDCPVDMTLQAPSGSTGVTVEFPNAASDNCPGATTVYSPASGSFFPIGATMVLAYSVDASGNENDTDCRFRVNVMPAIPLAPSSLGANGLHPDISVDRASITARVPATSGGSVQARLMRLSGDVIFERTVPSTDSFTEVRIDMTGQEQGIYLLQVVAGDQCSVSRLAYSPR